MNNPHPPENSTKITPNINPNHSNELVNQTQQNLNAIMEGRSELNKKPSIQNLNCKSKIGHVQLWKGRANSPSKMDAKT